MGPSPSVPADLAVFDYMPHRHVEAFKRAAGHFQAWILLRRGNPHSKKWIGRPGYIPKLLDCKAKTADFDVNGEGSTAGLVVSPILLPAAFGPVKHQKALAEWTKFEPHLYSFDTHDPRTNLTADRSGKHYTIQMDKKHKHYGCVIFKPVFRALGEYIHADYDLYAVVSFSDPKSNDRVRETGFGGEPHTRSRYQYDVQYFLKAAGVLPGQSSGVPMVRHGEQETFKTDWDDILDVFWPDGKSISSLNGSLAIQRFYATTLGGRRQFTKDTVPQPAGGKWERA